MTELFRIILFFCSLQVSDVNSTAIKNFGNMIHPPVEYETHVVEVEYNEKLKRWEYKRRNEK